MAIGSAMLSFSPVFFKLSGVPPTATGFYRMFFGGLILFVFVLFSKKQLWKGVKQFRMSVLCGFLFALDLAFWHKTIDLVGPGLATLMGNFQVFVLSAYGIIILKEKLSLRLIFAILMAVFGIAVIIGFDWSTLPDNYKSGVLYGALTALTFGLFLIALRETQRMDDALDTSANIAQMSMYSAFFLLLISYGLGESLALNNMRAFSSVMAYAVFGQVLGHIFISKGLSNTRPSLAGLLHLLQPALVYVWDIVIFSKQSNLVEFSGFVITLSAVYIGSTTEKE